MEKKNKKSDKPAQPERKSVLVSPRMTEKSVLQQESKGIYTFNVERDATKKSIMACVKLEYKVTPVMIRMVTVPSKQKFSRGKWGVKGGGKKAYVYLKKGDKINVA
ncbi:MAG: 50S ribosomal protein L23 [Patescibacteria group bacterium]